MKKRFQTEWWQEYPNRDVEFVRFYPCDIKLIKNPEEIWRPKEIVCYVHIPFCKAMCNYCGYNKYLWDASRAKDCLSALKKEIKMYAGKPYMQNCRIVALYFGGGTPTSLSTKQLRELLGLIKQNFRFSKDAEVSIEANPETVDKGRLKELIRTGFNRISFGLQSFDDGVLKMLNRRHTAAKAIEMVNLAKALDCPNVGIDLMYRLPGQTLAHWKGEINKAIKLKPDHISCYSLAECRGTDLYDQIKKGLVPPLPNDKTDAAMYEAAIGFLTKAGYLHYTTWDYALPGKECQYEIRHWGLPQFELLGLGAGAYSHINGYTYCNIFTIQEYINVVKAGRLPILMGKKLTAEEKISRALVFGMKCGIVNKANFKETFGIQINDIYNRVLRRLKQWELIKDDGENIKLTKKGKVYVDNVSKAFYTRNNMRKPQPLEIDLQQISLKEFSKKYK